MDFYEDGRPCARYPNHNARKQRAETSIKTYHLDHPAIVEKRRVLTAEIKAKIETADALSNNAMQETLQLIMRLMC